MDREQLLREIALATERAYRRGFQQGFLAAQGRLGADAPTDEQVEAWRFGPTDAAEAPPGSFCAGRRDRLVDRLAWEMADPDACPELTDLLEDSR